MDAADSAQSNQDLGVWSLRGDGSGHGHLARCAIAAHTEPDRGGLLSIRDGCGTFSPVGSGLPCSWSPVSRPANRVRFRCARSPV